MDAQLIGERRAFRGVLDAISLVAPVDTAVLLQGDRGTGKELVARAIHDAVIEALQGHTWPGNIQELQNVIERAVVATRSKVLEASFIGLSSEDASDWGLKVASIAHEVNQPLSGIMTNAGTCLRMLDANPPNVEGARETARRTIRDGNRASEVIKRLRALFSRRELPLESLDLNEMTREAIALSLSELQRNRVVLEAELADDLPNVTGDRIQLQQVLLNLLRNASDAMLGLHDRPRTLVVSTEREDGDRVRVSVRDAGAGIDAQGMNKLFDTFYTTKCDGMGIGLSVSRSIIERHHGRLWAETNDGPGATFSFSLPRSPQSDPETAPLRGGTMMFKRSLAPVVDDSATLRIRKGSQR